MDFSKLSYGQVQDIADQLNNSATSMEDLLDEIKTLFNKIGTDDVWSGTAASSAKEVFDTLSAKFPEFSQAIKDCHTYLLSVIENYKAVDNITLGQ